MRQLLEIEALANGSIKASCHLFSLRHDLYSSSVHFRRISVNLVLVTLAVVTVVLYRYFRSQFELEKFVHRSELFRHNWFQEHARVEKSIGILKENRMKDCSLSKHNIFDPLDANIPKKSESEISKDSPVEIKKLGLLPRDKLAAFSDLIRMNRLIYCILVLVVVSMWCIMLLLNTIIIMETVSVGELQSKTFPFAQYLETLRAYEHLLRSTRQFHKCVATISEMNLSISAVMTATNAFLVWERNASYNIIGTIFSVVLMSVQLELAINALYHTIIRYPTRKSGKDGNLETRIFVSGTYIHFYGISLKFLQIYFLNSTILMLLFSYELLDVRKN